MRKENKMFKDIKKFPKDKVKELVGTPMDELQIRFPDFRRDDLRFLRRKHVAKVASIPTPDAMLKFDIKERKMKGDKKGLDQKYKLLLAEFERVERENETLLSLKDYATQTYTIKPYQGATSESTAVLLLSDTHIEETVKKSTVNGLNEFNLDIAKERIDNFFKAGLHLTQLEERNTPIKNVVLWLGGDFISGNIHEELLETCSLRPVEAACRAMEHIESGIDFMLENSTYKFVVVCSAGNHTRITKKVHIATEMGNSLELFLYTQLAKKYKDNPRVEFVISDAYHTYVDVYGLTLRFHHGHAINYGGGVGGITIPVNKAIDAWNTNRRADMDIFGHFHQFFWGGRFVCNGSLIGYNPYAIRIKAKFEKPKQGMFIINQRLNEVIAVRPILV